MARYLVQTKFTADGAKALSEQGFQARSDQFKEIIAESGGTCEHYYFTDSGDVDVFSVISFSEDYGARGARDMLLALSSGSIADARLHRLYEGKELDAAADPNWTPPNT